MVHVVYLKRLNNKIKDFMTTQSIVGKNEINDQMIELSLETLSNPHVFEERNKKLALKNGVIVLETYTKARQLGFTHLQFNPIALEHYLQTNWDAIKKRFTFTNQDEILLSNINQIAEAAKVINKLHIHQNTTLQNLISIQRLAMDINSIGFDANQLQEFLIVDNRCPYITPLMTKKVVAGVKILSRLFPNQKIPEHYKRKLLSLILYFFKEAATSNNITHLNFLDFKPFDDSLDAWKEMMISCLEHNSTELYFTKWNHISEYLSLEDLVKVKKILSDKFSNLQILDFLFEIAKLIEFLRRKCSHEQIYMEIFITDNIIANFDWLDLFEDIPLTASEDEKWNENLTVLLSLFHKEDRKKIRHLLQNHFKLDSDHIIALLYLFTYNTSANVIKFLPYFVEFLDKSIEQQLSDLQAVSDLIIYFSQIFNAPELDNEAITKLTILSDLLGKLRNYRNIRDFTIVNIEEEFQSFPSKIFIRFLDQHELPKLSAEELQAFVNGEEIFELEKNWAEQYYAHAVPDKKSSRKQT